MIAGDQESSEYKEDQGKTPQEWARYWTKEKDAAEKRLRKWRKQGTQIVQRYLDERANDDANRHMPGQMTRLNLFHTNVSTMQSMLFGSTPKIEVAREHHDPDDDVARVAGLMYQRILEADVSSSGHDLATCLKAALQDRLLPGLGMARVRYEAEFTEVDAIEATEEGVTVVKSEQLSSEECNVEYVHWQDTLWGWARTWTEVPWLGYRAWMCKDECIERFGEKVAQNLEYKNQKPSGIQDATELDNKDQNNNVQKAEIWEFWLKHEKKVFWWSPGAEYILDAEDDPLELEGFYPSPMPLVANPTTSLLVPRADFIMAQDLYNQVDELNTRISIITRAIKVVGVYDKAASNSVGRMLKEGTENDLIPVDNWAMFAEKGGLQGTIDWFPVQDVVGVLQTLRQILNDTVEQLYQVTGMSDILRGAQTDQYTAAGTEQLKAKFGSIRVQALQDEFARFASDLDGLKAEVVSKHFSPETILQQSNAMFLPAPDQDKIGPALQLMQSPEIRWRVNIRPESIAMVDYAQLKQERTEFLNAMATYIQSAQAAAREMPGATPVLLEMLKWGMAGFKGSNYLEGIMDQAIEMAKQAAQQPKEDPQAQQAQMAMQQAQQEHQMEMQKIQAKAQADLAVQQAKTQAAMQQEQQDHQNKMQQEMTEHQNEMRKLQEEFIADLKLVEQNLMADLQTEQAQSAYAIEEETVRHQYEMEQLGADHATNMTEKVADAEMAARQQDRETDTD
jgi:hypothetical protein